MIILPAIDIIDGQAVRLYQGDYSKKEVVANDIFGVARKFQDLGAEYLHLVDLDGAKEGYCVNKKIILSLVKNLNIPIEIGGGIRDFETIKMLIENGIDRVILGTIAIENEALLKKAIQCYGGKISVGIDCNEGYVYGRGWLSKSKLNYLDFAKKMDRLGVKNIIVTDISKDGTLEGPNFDMLKNLKGLVNMDITASGGIKDIKDIKALNDIGIYGAITGKAIYSGNLSLKDAIDITI